MPTVWMVHVDVQKDGLRVVVRRNQGLKAAVQRIHAVEGQNLDVQPKLRWVDDNPSGTRRLV